MLRNHLVLLFLLFNCNKENSDVIYRYNSNTESYYISQNIDHKEVDFGYNGKFDFFIVCIKDSTNDFNFMKHWSGNTLEILQEQLIVKNQDTFRNLFWNSKDTLFHTKLNKGTFVSHGYQVVNNPKDSYFHGIQFENGFLVLKNYYRDFLISDSIKVNINIDGKRIDTIIKQTDTIYEINTKTAIFEGDIVYYFKKGGVNYKSERLPIYGAKVDNSISDVFFEVLDSCRTKHQVNKMIFLKEKSLKIAGKKFFKGNFTPN